MSGGHFEGGIYKIQMLAEELEQFIEQQWRVRYEEDHPNNHQYNIVTLAKLQKTAETLHKAFHMINRVDYLLSGDDSETSFHERWTEERLD